MTTLIKPIKYLGFIILTSLLFPSCTKECCYDGNPIENDDALDIIDNNELSDTLFNVSIGGTLKSISGKPLKNITIILKDTLGREFKIMTDDEGSFDRTKLLSGVYHIRFENLPSYAYSFDEYNTIIQDISNIVTGQKVASKADTLAYHVVNFDDGITTLDKIYFTKFQDGQDALGNYQPWRLITRTDFDNGNLNINDSLEVQVKDNEDLFFDIILIYIGDPTGFTI
ncbi:MAG TPA: carboxypeptidase-like regulatory domain-containing protein [Saprospiraceae bacterium]|nr:carboxypeptidase-like regulatory domain-containing protein [Saprospiraceae bacterium]